jgi:hypothetical protein
MKTCPLSRLLYVSAMLLAVLSYTPRAKAQQEVPPEFRIEYYSEVSTNGVLPSERQTIWNLEFVWTNLTAIATNITTYEAVWKAAYHQVVDTNIYTWTALDEETGEFGVAVNDWTQCYEEYVNQQGNLVPATNKFGSGAAPPYPGIWVKSGSGRKGVINNVTYGTVNQYLTKGVPGSSNSYIYQITATATAAPSLLDIPKTNITFLGKTLNAEGYGYPVLQDNTTNGATPSIPAFPNYFYNLSVSKMMLQLQFRNTGTLTQRETNSAGYQPDLWDRVVNAVGTDALGASLPVFNTLAGNPPQAAKRFANQKETDAIVFVGSEFNNGWAWQRDVRSKASRLSATPNGGVLNEVIATYTRDFTPNAMTAGGNDSVGGIPSDVTPDINRLIINSDSPSLHTDPQEQSPVGTVWVVRTFAREWLTWNGGIASDVIKWHSFITIRKTGQGTWAYVGKNEIALTADGDPENPNILYPEANSLIYPSP